MLLQSAFSPSAEQYFLLWFSLFPRYARKKRKQMMIKYLAAVRPELVEGQAEFAIQRGHCVSLVVL